MSKNINLSTGTITYFKSRAEGYATKFNIVAKIDDALFYGEEKFDTETEAETKIQQLESFLKIKPKLKKKVLLLESPKNDN